MDNHAELWDAITTAERRHRWLRDNLVAGLADELGSLQALVAQLQNEIDHHHPKEEN